jgi:hypothetical protein
VKFSLPAAALLWVFPHLAIAQVAILHIRVTEGEGALMAPGARSPHPLAVEITDETGKPVAGAAVSFHLPDEGPSGTCGNGLRTEVAVSDVRGRAALRSLQANRTPGRLAISIVASKEQARAGMVSYQYIVEAKSGTTSSKSAAASHGHLKWVLVAVAAGGAAAAGALLASHSSSAAASTAASSSATPATPAGVTIGAPSITVGRP